MTRRKPSFYTNTRVENRDGKQVVIPRSPTTPSLSMDSAKHKQHTVKQYDPGILDQFSKLHSKQYGVRYRFVLSGNSVILEMSQTGSNLDSEVRIIHLGTVKLNCFIPLDEIIFTDRGKTAKVSFEQISDYLGVSTTTLLNQCKDIASKQPSDRTIEKSEDSFKELSGRGYNIKKRI